MSTEAAPGVTPGAGRDEESPPGDLSTPADEESAALGAALAKIWSLSGRPSSSWASCSPRLAPRLQDTLLKMVLASARGRSEKRSR